MVRASDIQEKLLHIIGWQQNYDTSDLKIADALTESESGLYFQQVHPLLTLQNMSCIAPDFKNVTYPEYNVNTKYKKGNIVQYEGKLYKAKKDNSGLVPNLGRNLLIGGGNFELIEDSLPDNGENNSLTSTPESFVKVTSKNPHTGHLALHLVNNTKNNKNFRLFQWINDESPLSQKEPWWVDPLDTTPFSNFSIDSKFKIRVYAKSNNPSSFKLGGFTCSSIYIPPRKTQYYAGLACSDEDMGSLGQEYSATSAYQKYGYGQLGTALTELSYIGASDYYKGWYPDMLDKAFIKAYKSPILEGAPSGVTGFYQIDKPFNDSDISLIGYLIRRVESIKGINFFRPEYTIDGHVAYIKAEEKVRNWLSRNGTLWKNYDYAYVAAGTEHYEVAYGKDTYKYEEFQLTDSYQAYEMVYATEPTREFSDTEVEESLYSVGLSIIVPGNSEVYIDDCGIFENIEPDEQKWKEYWEETNPFSEWLEDKTKASIQKAITRFCNEKTVQGTNKNLCENRTLFDGAGRIVDTVENKHKLVGFEIVPVRAKGVTTKINKIGLQFTEPGEYTLYLMHSSRDLPVKVIKLNKTSHRDMEWFTLNDIYLPYQSADNDAGGSWYLCYYQGDLPNSSQAIRKNKDWSKSPCGSCSRNELIAWQAWSKYIEIHPFVYMGSQLRFVCNDENTNDCKLIMWDVEDNQYTYNNNYGINLEITVSCDITDFIIEQRALFQDVIAKQVAIDMLREFAYNANVRTNRHSINASRLDILYEVDGDSSSMKKSGLSYQLDMAFKALNISTSGIDRVCLPCKNNGIKYRTV